MPCRVVSYEYPYRLQSVANGSHGHWAVKAKTVKAARHAATIHTLAAVPAALRDPSQWSGIEALIVRHGPRKLDLDNLYSSAKSTIDGIASVFGVDDGADFWTWRCEQNRGPYRVSVVLRMTAALRREVGA
jgi:hypothetical protein